MIDFPFSNDLWDGKNLVVYGMHSNFLCGHFPHEACVTLSLWGKMPELPRQKCRNKRVMNYQLLP